MENIKDKIIIYQTADGTTNLEVKMDKDTVWLSQAQMAELFQKDRSVIGRHINNVYKEKELTRDITCAKFAHMGADADQTYFTTLYNLDVIISVGYRVKSTHPQGTDWRIAAAGGHARQDDTEPAVTLDRRDQRTLQRGDRLHLRSRHSR